MHGLNISLYNYKPGTKVYVHDHPIVFGIIMNISGNSEQSTLGS